MSNKMTNVKFIIKCSAHQSKKWFECAIECQTYCVDKSETKCEMVHQSRIGFECVIKCQIYYVNKCETEFEIVHQSKIKFEQG